MFQCLPKCFKTRCIFIIILLHSRMNDQLLHRILIINIDDLQKLLGIINTKPPKTYVSIRPERYTYELVKKSGELVLNLTTEELVKAADFCGVRSGRTVDKFEKCRLTPLSSVEVSAPTLDQSPLSLECRVFEELDLGSHRMFLLDVVAVTVREELLDKGGKLHLEKCGLAAYAHGDYFSLGKKLGSFGFSVRKKHKLPPKANKKS